VGQLHGGAGPEQSGAVTHRGHPLSAGGGPERSGPRATRSTPFRGSVRRAIGVRTTRGSPAKAGGHLGDRRARRAGEAPPSHAWRGFRRSRAAEGRGGRRPPTFAPSATVPLWRLRSVRPGRGDARLPSARRRPSTCRCRPRSSPGSAVGGLSCCPGPRTRSDMRRCAGKGGCTVGLGDDHETPSWPTAGGGQPYALVLAALSSDRDGGVSADGEKRQAWSADSEPRATPGRGRAGSTRPDRPRRLRSPARAPSRRSSGGSRPRHGGCPPSTAGRRTPRA
jgi:hypothetical protein